jgi:2-(1,2-epoxy-1,2-dihydrophenyl)acetyl-CoA isomerase
MTEMSSNDGINPVLCDIAGNIAVVRMTSERTRNAMSPALLEGLNLALDEIETRLDDVRCVVLTGADRAFCAGADLGAGDGAEMFDDDGQLDLGIAMDRTYHPLLHRLRDLHCPLITAVNGVAAGGGMSLALMGDLVVAAESASFVQSFRHIGLAPDMGATFLLPRLVGFGRALELSLLGDRLDAATALDWGLINRVYPAIDLMAETMALALRLASGPTVALKLTRDAYWQSFESSHEEQLDFERESQRALGRTADFGIGVTGFLKKETPRFRGC